MASLEYHIFKDFDVIFDEKGSKYGTIRMVQWVPEGKEPEEEKAKLEIRHMINSAEGETYGKGYAFDTEEGPSELTEAMVKLGFGDTREILRGIARRDDFKEAVENINKEDDILSPDDQSELFDMRDLMLFSEEENEEDAA